MSDNEQVKAVLASGAALKECMKYARKQRRLFVKRALERAAGND